MKMKRVSFLHITASFLLLLSSFHLYAQLPPLTTQAKPTSCSGGHWAICDIIGQNDPFADLANCDLECSPEKEFTVEFRVDDSSIPLEDLNITSFQLNVTGSHGDITVLDSSVVDVITSDYQDQFLSLKLHFVYVYCWGSAANRTVTNNISFDLDVQATVVSTGQQIDFDCNLISVDFIPDEVCPSSIPNNNGFEKRINCGGPAVTTASGVSYETDQAYIGSSGVYGNSNPISGTTDDVIYQTERWGSNFGYEVPLPDGVYDVTLHFAELYWQHIDRRVFDVTVEGQYLIVHDFDIYQKVGRYAATQWHLDRVMVMDGKLDIDFVTALDNAKLSAIEIVESTFLCQQPQQSIRVNCGAYSEMNFGGYSFLTDQYFTSTNSTTYYKNTTADIAQTTHDELYKSERTGNANLGSFSYHIPVSNGDYEVVLHFAEIYWGAPGGGPGGSNRRVFDVDIEGTPSLINYDINQQAGPMQAQTETFTVTVSDGNLDIVLSADKDRPKISAIEVLAPQDFGTSIAGGSSSRTGQLTPALKLHPNPASDKAILTISRPTAQPMNVQLYDVFGKLYYQTKVEMQSAEMQLALNLSDLAPGIYFIRVSAEDFQGVEKLWIER